MCCCQAWTLCALMQVEALSTGLESKVNEIDLEKDKVKELMTQQDADKVGMVRVCACGQGTREGRAASVTWSTVQLPDTVGHARTHAFTHCMPAGIWAPPGDILSP